MTALPVDRAEAERVFNKLVRSKTAKGYADPNAPARSQPSARAPRQRRPQTEAIALQKQAVLRRLRGGDAKYPEWPLNRAMWRAS